MFVIHNDEGSMGAGSLFSKGFSYKQLTYRGQPPTSRGLSANILRVNVFRNQCWVLASVGLSARVTGRLETFIGSYRSTVHRGSQPRSQLC